ncbi:gamma-glutamylcyclotransferase [Planktotalea sp.]|uniref:gamma-glutamylcyclotransferase n=1 Tax=Planktotalea sp. TaxID=2029877 RepID=UPI003F6C82D4
MTMWVFGYGSLLWNPGFEVEETQIGVMHGFARSFCMRSIHHRGTPEHPGLVLALDEQKGASCEGVALRVKAGTEAETLAYLRERELISSAYLEKKLAVHLNTGDEIEAVTYVIDPDHAQYGHLDLEEQAQVIAHAVGDRGPNTEYLHNTAAHLVELGIEDADLNWLSKRVESLCS